MKKCPHCGRELEDSARFCLYCMALLEQKENIVFPKRRIKQSTAIILIAAVVFCAVFLAVVTFWGNNGTSLTEGGTAGTSAPSTSAPATALPDATASGEAISLAPSATVTLTVAPTDTPLPTPAPTPAPTLEPTASPTASPTIKQTVKPGEPTSEPTGEPTATPSPTPTSSPTATPTASPTAGAQPTVSVEPTQTATAATKVTYTWRTASPSDEFYPKPGEYSYIVITGVILEEESNGIFVIPENIVQNIDGTEITHTVIGVDQNAFSGTGAREIYFPKTIHHIYSPVIPYAEQTEDPLHLYVAAHVFYFDYTNKLLYEKPMLYKNFVLHCPKAALRNNMSGDLYNIDINTKYINIANYEEWNG